MKKPTAIARRDGDELLTVKETAAFLKLYKRDGITLNCKSVYDLPIKRTNVPGVGVRFWKSDLISHVERKAA